MMLESQRIVRGCQRRILVRMMNGRKAVMVEPLRFLPIVKDAAGDEYVKRMPA
jgi:hypothetical protein